MNGSENVAATAAIEEVKQHVLKVDHVSRSVNWRTILLDCSLGTDISNKAHLTPPPPK